MTNPSPVIFVGVLASKVRKIKIKIQSQRDEASQRRVKHNITISLHTFLKTCSACLFDFNGRREVYLKIFQRVVAKHCASRSILLVLQVTAMKVTPKNPDFAQIETIYH